MSNQIIQEAITEIVQKGLSTATPQETIVDLIFCRLTGFRAEHMSIALRQSPLFKQIEEEATFVDELKSNIGQLAADLEEDILDRFNNRDHWDLSLIDKYITDSIDCTDEEAYRELVSDLVENWMGPIGRADNEQAYVPRRRR